jgi:integrase
MPKTNIPNYRLHKATGQAFVELGGRRFYLGKHGSKSSKEEYERRIAEHLANGRKIPPTQTKTGISCQELAIHFLEWAEDYYMSQPKSFAHVRKAMEFLVKHYGRESVDKFSPMSLVYLQKKLVEHGYARPMVNRYVGVIKRAFKHGAKFGWAEPNTSYALQVVDNLKKGRTKAHEFRVIKPVDPDVFEKTLAELPKRVADMCRIQRNSTMRPQDVCNLRACDIDRSGDVWIYRPPAHKTAYLGEVLTKYIGSQAQAILMSYLLEKEDSPEAFLFSPADTVRDRNIEKRRNRKTLNKKGEVQPSHKNRKKVNPKRAPGMRYTTASYNRAITAACKKASVPHWSVNQIRQLSATKIRQKCGLEAAQVACGHKRASTTEIYAEIDLEAGIEVARRFGGCAHT